MLCEAAGRIEAGRQCTLGGHEARLKLASQAQQHREHRGW